MSKNSLHIVVILGMLLMFQIYVQAQTTGSIAGTVTDVNGAIVPGATVAVKGEAGQEFTATTSDNGTYRIPAVANGIYTVTITSLNFKTFLVQNVKVDVGTPATVDAALEAGKIEESVVVTSGGEVLQTQTATVNTNIQGRQIRETPTASRDALDLVGLLPGTAQVGRPRASSINGLPKGAVAISIDGVDVQSNDSRSSDGFFTFVRPRVDAIEEVTVSTANPGSETSGDGAVQIKFVTRRGTNDYRGGLFWTHRNSALNAAYWYVNRDGARDDNGKALRDKIILNQYGGNFSGPIPFLGFGEGVPIFNSGRDKRFFFINYEEFRQPKSQSRTRTILTPDAQSGIFRYIVGGQTRSVNLFDLAQRNGQLATADPTVTALLRNIRSAVGTTGTLVPITSAAGVVTDPNRQRFIFTPNGGDIRKFLALRLDFNITKNHSLEFVTNRDDFVPTKDFLNSQDERYPGFPFYTQGSLRQSYAAALRSTLSSNIINEARIAIATGPSSFAPGISPDDFDYQGGYALGIDAAGITTATSRNSSSVGRNPTIDITDNLTWARGNHSISFGGQYKRIKFEDLTINRVVPTVSFGIDATDTAFGMFANSTTSLAGASTTQLTEARNLYATLIGRVTGYATTAYLTADGTYQENGPQLKKAHQDTYGLFAQDSWRIRPNLTINYGVRWQPQGSFVVDSANYARLEAFEQIYGLSGVGNLFKPGTFTGTAPRVVALKVGEKTFKDDINNFAPSFGAVWSPDFGEKGILRTVFGPAGRSVFRGGYSIGFVREGTSLITSIVGGNPGGNISASRTLAIGNLRVGTNLRDPGNTNLTAATFPATPAYPFTLTNANSANAYDPNLRTGTIHSYSAGYQRELDKNTVVEFRYVGNRGVDLWRQHDLNELNTIENGFATEFAAAQNNLYFNIANNRCQPGQQNTNPAGANYNQTCQYNFAYTGAGTTPLPATLAYISRVAATLTPGSPGSLGTVSGTGASVISNYSDALFRNTTLNGNLSRNAPALITFAGNIENNAARRTNAIAAGLPSNFFYVSPTTVTALNRGAFVVDNSGKTWYNSGVIEVRRRLSDGLRLQANYVWSKAQSNFYASNDDVFANISNRESGLNLAKNVQPFDVRHNFKMDATYDLPFGKGRTFFSTANGFINQIVGGFTLLPTVRWQSGSPFSLGNVQLVGMTSRELQKEIKVRKGPGAVTYLPDDIILNTQRAFNINVNTTTGYGSTFDPSADPNVGAAPTGRFIAPAGYGNCQQRKSGDCGFTNLILYGPSFFKFDIALSKKFLIDEKRNIEFRATFLDALNAPNFRIGGWGADVISLTAFDGTFGQLGSGSAYQDISTTNDPGGRLIDLMLRINF